jgi:hypothetical protein
VLASGISWHDATKFRARGLMGVPVRLPYLGPYSLVVPCYYPLIDFVVVSGAALLITPGRAPHSPNIRSAGATPP